MAIEDTPDTVTAGDGGTKTKIGGTATPNFLT